MQSTSGSQPSQELQESLSCPICLDICVRPTTTQCGHTFCRRCLRSALASSQSSSQCPSCRASLGNLYRDGSQLAVNFALWSVIQSLFPRENLPESPALHQTTTTTRPSTLTTTTATTTSARGPTRLNRQGQQPFLPPRFVVPLPSQSQSQQQGQGQQQQGVGPPAPARPSRLRRSTTASTSTSISSQSSRGQQLRLIGNQGQLTISRRVQNTSIPASPPNTPGEETRNDLIIDSPSEVQELEGEETAGLFSRLALVDSVPETPPSTSTASYTEQEEGDVIDLTGEESENEEQPVLQPVENISARPPRKIVSGLFYSRAPSRLHQQL